MTQRLSVPGIEIGNRLFTAFITWMFGKCFTDIFSGYRVFSRRFVKSFPALSSGFEIETELTVHALELALPGARLQLRIRHGQTDRYRSLTLGEMAFVFS